MTLNTKTLFIAYLLILGFIFKACYCTNSSDLDDNIDSKSRTTIDPIEHMILFLQRLTISITPGAYSKAPLIVLCVLFVIFHALQWVSVKHLKSQVYGKIFFGLEVCTLLTLFIEGIVLPGALTSIYRKISAPKGKVATPSKISSFEIFRVFVAFYTLQAMFEILKSLILKVLKKLLYMVPATLEVTPT